MEQVYHSEEPPTGWHTRMHHTVIGSLAEQSKEKIVKQVKVVRMFTVIQGRTGK